MLALPFLSFAVLASSGCFVIHGSEIRVGDLAAAMGISSEVASPDTILAPAPRPGMRRTVNASLLNGWLDKSGLRERGSREVISQITLPSTLCVEQERTSLSASAIEESIRESLPQRNVVLIIVKYSQEVLPPGRVSFPVSGAARPSPVHPDAPFLWRGVWLSEQGAAIPVWVSVRAYRFLPEVRLRVSLPAGSMLNEAQLETATAVRSAFDEKEDDLPRKYAGKVLKRFCASGSALNDRVVEPVPVIRKDSVVPVQVVSGDLRLKLTARAETDGWSGQVIPFVIPAGHRKFRARVQPGGFAVLVMDPASSVGTGANGGPRTGGE